MSNLDRKVFTHKIGDGSYVLDSRYFPMLVTGWVGDLNRELVEHFYNVRSEFTSYARESGLKVMQITDTSRMNLPPASVRKLVADSTLQADAEAGCMLEYVVVVPNAIMRGMVTAITWVTREKGAPTVNVGSLEAAISRIANKFRELGIDFASPGSSYTLPNA